MWFPIYVVLSSWMYLPVRRHHRRRRRRSRELKETGMWALAGLEFGGRCRSQERHGGTPRVPPQGAGTEPAPTTSLLISAFLLDPSLYTTLIKKKKITTELFELEAGGRWGFWGRVWELGKVFGGKGALSLQGLLGVSEPGDLLLRLWVQGLGWAWPQVTGAPDLMAAPNHGQVCVGGRLPAVASPTPLCLVAWRSLSASCPLPPLLLGHLRAAL